MSKDIKKKKGNFKRNIIIIVVLAFAIGVGGVATYNTFFNKTKASTPKITNASWFKKKVAIGKAEETPL